MHPDLFTSLLSGGFSYALYDLRGVSVRIQELIQERLEALNELNTSVSLAEYYLIREDFQKFNY
jgi:hypothetical protein